MEAIDAILAPLTIPRDYATFIAHQIDDINKGFTVHSMYPFTQGYWKVYRIAIHTSYEEVAIYAIDELERRIIGWFGPWNENLGMNTIVEIGKDVPFNSAKLRVIDILAPYVDAFNKGIIRAAIGGILFISESTHETAVYLKAMKAMEPAINNASTFGREQSLGSMVDIACRSNDLEVKEIGINALENGISYIWGNEVIIRGVQRIMQTLPAEEVRLRQKAQSILDRL